LVGVADAMVADAALALQRTTVRSPLDGIVMERLMSPGSVVRFGPDEHASHLVHVYDPAHLQVRADVPLAEASGVGVGHPAEIVVDVLPDRVFTGAVTRFVHRADLQKNTIEAKVRIDDPSGLLKPDMLARVRILQPQQQGDSGAPRMVPRIFTPQEAIIDGTHVLVISDASRGGGTAALREVRLGTTIIDGWIDVLDGLAPGDQVILDATPDLAGTTVQIATSEAR
jgi:HlyD family secretion protein